MLGMLKRVFLRTVQWSGYDIVPRRPARPLSTRIPDTRSNAESRVKPAVSGRDSPDGPSGAPKADATLPPAVHDVDYQALMATQAQMAGFADFDPEALPLIDFVRPYTMTSMERLFDLYSTIKYLVQADIRGDIVECGVWRGGSMMMVAKTLMSFGDTSRTLYLFDTYEGHPKPDAELDRDLWGNNPLNEWINYRKTDETSDWAYVSIDEVRANMARTGYPADKIVLVKGMVERTAPANASDKVALIRLDTDWYASAKVALETFWPRLVRNGFLILDDYGHYRGQRQVVSEYFANIPIKLNRIDYSCRSIQKTG